MTHVLFGLSAFGGLAVLLGLAAACLFGFSFAREEGRIAREKRDQAVRRDAIRDVGHWLLADCVWFSEDRPSMEAIRLLGQNLRDTGATLAPEAKGKWRNVVAEARNLQAVKEASCC